MNNILLRPRIASAIVRFTDPFAIYQLHSNTVSFPRSTPSLVPAQNRDTLKFSSAFRRCSPICSMASSSPSSIYEITVKNAKGEDVCLEKFKGKVLLIVNVASQCGLTTSNYTELTEVYQKYKDQGLEILAFPCNQFGGQEPGTNEEIQNFVCTRFRAEYPIFDKVEVNGSGAHPLYKYLKSAKGGILGDAIKWNFTKFLVNKDGEVVERYAPTTSPSKIEKDIQKYL